MRVIIDRKTCVSCGACSDVCPGLFEQNPDDTFSQIVEKFRLNGTLGEGWVSEELEGCAHEAADLCPVQIIRIEE